MQKKTNNLHIANDNTRKLSIQFSLDGFSFCITNTKNKIIYFSETIFDNNVDQPQDLLKKIETAFKSEEVLQQDFSTILAIHQNKLSTLVPEEYFNKKLLKKYLTFNIKTLQTDFITFDDIEALQAKNVYIPYVNVNNFLFQHFGEFEYKHHTTILIEKLMAINKAKEKKMFVNVSTNNLDIIILENKQLLFSNSFSFHTPEDFIYYILFTAEQLKLDPENFILTFLGAIEKESEIYTISYHYIRNIDFYKSKNPFFETSSFSHHQHFILLE